MKRALLIGIDDYDNCNHLNGCVNDVNALLPLLNKNDDDSPNFDCRTMVSIKPQRVERKGILHALDQLLAPGADISMFYFAGHGSSAKNDVVLVSQDGDGTDSGVALSEVLSRVQNSRVSEVIIVLDCCFAGGAGGVPQLGDANAVLREGVSIMTACRRDQTAAETPAGRGLFSYYLCGALEGGAADVVGGVTLAGIYAYLSESFGVWNQRPTFKSNVDRLHKLRQCDPAVPLEHLRRLPEFFSNANEEMPLDPSFEPTEQPKNPEHEAIFAILQKCRAAKLVDPVGADHMYFAAMQSTACKLTPLGKHYHNLAVQGRI